MNLDLRKISLQVAEKLREIATRQGNVPFDKGDLRKAHISENIGEIAILSANTPYARRIHDGSGPVTVRKRSGKPLKKPWVQPARKGNPWLARAVEELEAEGLDFLAPELGQDVADELTRTLRKRGFDVRPHKK